MPQGAPLNGSAPGPVPEGPWSRVAGMQAKLHRWAAADPGRRFDDLFNFVHDPATLIVAFARVAGNQGANTPGVDGVTAAWVEEQVGVPGFLDDLRAAFDLLWYQGMSQAEAAALLGVAVPTVKLRWMKARLRVQQALGGSPFDGTDPAG